MVVRKIKPAAIEARRCVIYARKSNIRGMEQRFNSVNSQVEMGTQFAAQRVGWSIVGKPYCDGGKSGATIERPEFRRLMADAKAGLFDTVIVYKLDRVARSVLAFAEIKAYFDALGVRFVFVTEDFPDDPNGRFLLNMRMSASEYERDIGIERTKDKIATTRRKGMWAGGAVPLGYDSVDKRLVINPREATIVREIFESYLQRRSASSVATLLRAKGYRTKQRKSKTGLRGARTWTKAAVLQTLRNPLYAALIPHESELHPADHEAIITRETFDTAAALLGSNVVDAEEHPTNPAYFLRGVLRCSSTTIDGSTCGHALTPGSTRKGDTEYRYYRCSGREKLGTDVCGCKSLAADALETYVVDQIQAAALDTGFMRQLRGTVSEAAAFCKRLTAQRSKLAASIEKLTRDGERLVEKFQRSDNSSRKLLERRVNETAEALRSSEAHLMRLDSAIVELRGAETEAAWVIDQLGSFKAAWSSLNDINRARLVSAMFDEINVNEQAGRLELVIAPLARRLTTIAKAGYADDSDLAMSAPPEAFRVTAESALFRRRNSAVAFTDKAPVAPLPVRRPAKVARMLALAHHTERAIRDGAFADRATVARYLEMSRARITYLLQLTALAPDIQEEILFMTAVDGVEPLTERALRPIARVGNWARQRLLWARTIAPLLAQPAAATAR